MRYIAGVLGVGSQILLKTYGVFCPFADIPRIEIWRLCRLLSHSKRAYSEFSA